MDRKRTGKTLSNKDRKSPVDPEARITKMKVGRTHLAYKPEHAVDLDTGVVVAIEVHEADKDDTSTLGMAGSRRVWLRGRENIQKRYLIHVAGFNLGLLMRKDRPWHPKGLGRRLACDHLA